MPKRTRPSPGRSNPRGAAGSSDPDPPSSPSSAPAPLSSSPTGSSRTPVGQRSEERRRMGRRGLQDRERALRERLMQDDDDDQPTPADSEDLDEMERRLQREAEEEEADEGEDLFGENFERDYRALAEDDHYDGEDLDEAAYSPITAEQRRAAETELGQRDRQRRVQQERAGRGGRRLPTALLGSEEDELSSEDRNRRVRRRIVSSQLSSATERDLSSEMEPVSFAEDDDERMGTSFVAVDLENVEGPLREFIAQDATRREIMRRFRNFLRQYNDEKGHSVYGERIRAMCAANRESLEVSYMHLGQEEPVLATWLADSPTEMLAIFDDVAMMVVLSQFPEYDQIRPEIHVRITDLPICDNLRDIRQVHLNGFIKVSGVVTRRTGVFPQLKLVKFNCGKCNGMIGPLVQQSNEEIRIGACPNCQSRGPFHINQEDTVYRNFQKIMLQESPGSVPPGRLPRSKEVILLGDLIDQAKPGEEVEVTGTYRHSYDAGTLNMQQGFPVFNTVIEANFITRKDSAKSSFQLTEDDVAEIRRLSQDPHIGRKVIRSIAPSIYGHEDIKTALAMSLFGGQPKDVDGKHRIRGDINVLLLGDPGTAKSQFLKYLEKTAPRAVFTTGKGSTAVGLTASVHRDPVTREWTLEGGALVLADNGMCLIDEFDKMNDQDRTSIHEAMEQQSISISKAGIVTTLQARCSVVAAANPIKGRYDPSLTFFHNVELTEPILTRFDVMCVVRDTVDTVYDEKLAEFVVQSHMKSHPESTEEVTAQDDVLRDVEGQEIISQEMLRKYIQFARENYRPRMQDVDQDKIAKLYADLRRESISSGGIPISVRYIESLIRLAEAHARVHLRDYVNSEDVNVAIRVLIESFINTQKFQVMRQLRKSFRRYITYNRDNNELLFHLLQTLVKETVEYRAHIAGVDSAEGALDRIDIHSEEFENRARELDIHDVHSFYKTDIFAQNKFSYDPEKKVIAKLF